MTDFNQILLEVLSKISTNNKWTSSLFEKATHIPTTTRGDVGESFVQEALSSIGIKAERNTHRGSYDILINDTHTVEIKTATEDTHGKFQFNGIRYHRKYDFIFVLGIAPNNIYFNIYAGSDVKGGKIGSLVSMEKGAVGSQKLTRTKEQLFTIDKLQELATEKFTG